MNQEIFDISIVGAGAAGLTAALYALRARKSVLIFEHNAIGGQILPAHKISNYPALPAVSGQEFADQLKSQVKELGAVFALESVLSAEKLETADSLKDLEVDSAPSPSQLPLFRITSDEESYFSRALILANGSAERKLDLPGESDLVGHGISYCATCDGAFFAGKEVAVYGGGASAVSATLYLSEIAKKVSLIHRSNAFRADEKLLDQISEHVNLSVLHNSLITRLNLSKASSSPTLQSITLENTRTKEKTQLPVSALFVNIGRSPENQAFSNLVDLDENGYIDSDETCSTRTEGVFCAGDTRKKALNQLVTATSDGAVAATAALEYLRSL